MFFAYISVKHQIRLGLPDVEGGKKGEPTMKKQSAKIILIGTILAALIGYANGGLAEVNVNIGIGVPLPSVVISAPPAVVLIPATYVYFVPDVSADVFFYHGHWYRPHHGHYYRAASYNGPWVSIVPSAVPKAIRYVPSDFRRVPPGHKCIHHGELMKNWDTWEKKKHWDKQANARQAKEGNGGGKGDHKQGKGGGKGKNKD
jgi:hypothetical protein